MFYSGLVYCNCTVYCYIVSYSGLVYCNCTVYCNIVFYSGLVYCKCTVYCNIVFYSGLVYWNCTVYCNIVFYSGLVSQFLSKSKGERCSFCQLTSKNEHKFSLYKHALHICKRCLFNIISAFCVFFVKLRLVAPLFAETFSEYL